ncbi:MAG: manganese-dependent inorganic pyrophosphatase [Candidatus Jordarchaeales archaeon]
MADVYVVGHKAPDTDSVCSAIAYAKFKREVEGVNAEAARADEINPETEYVLNYFKVNVPPLLKDAKGKKLILVDHNEFAQAVNGVENAEILEVLDHHKIVFKYPEPILFHAEPVGSTATLVAKKYFEKGIKVPYEVAGILLAAILSDTVVFKSATCTPVDREVALKLAEMVKVDPERFGIEIKKAKASLRGKTASEILMADFKDYEFKGVKVGVGQVEVFDLQEALERKKEILEEMERKRSEGKYGLILMMLTDIIKEGTELLAVGERIDVVEKAFGKRVKDGSVYLEGVMSRKKEVIPPLEKAFG